nr:hypothetical protein [Tanacetum cinerariifolium]
MILQWYQSRRFETWKKQSTAKEDDRQAVMECYKEYIGVENTMKEHRDRSRKGQEKWQRIVRRKMELQRRLHEMMSRWKAIRTKRIPRGLHDFMEEDLEFEIKENNNKKRLVVWNKTENYKGVLGHGLWNRNSIRHKRKKTPTLERRDEYEDSRNKT